MSEVQKSLARTLQNHIQAIGFKLSHSRQVVQGNDRTCEPTKESRKSGIMGNSETNTAQKKKE
jgi:hypothetical protein